MSTPETIFYLIYITVAFFYLICGVLLLLYPHKIEHLLKKLFPVLVAFNYSSFTNSLNLIFVGCGLLIISKLISLQSLAGVYLALILSALEVYLGFRFYYREEHDQFQTYLHIIPHLLLCAILLWMVAHYFTEEVTLIETTLSLVIMSLL